MSLGQGQPFDAEFMAMQKARLATASEELNTIRPRTLLDTAQEVRQGLVQASTILATVLNDQDAPPHEDRGIDKPHDSLGQELELIQMVMVGLLDRARTIQNRIGKL